ncbi:hypothetical protein BDZ97DRAFT_1875423 [Flammula alnicola]|nr:hypothetical protein BDZ97DRAFT_1875423 [Flammula alnicola]
MDLSARCAPCFLKNAAPRLDVYLSLEKILEFNSMQKDLRQVSSSYVYRTRLVSHLQSHFRQKFLSNFHDAARVEWMNSLAEYMAKTHEAFPSLREHSSSHVQDERRTVQGTAEPAYHPKSRSNSPISNAGALQARPRHWYSQVKFKISQRMERRQ